MIRDYYPGKGCQCYAHSEYECACNVDWTDPEVYKLRDEVKRVEEQRDEAIRLATLFQTLYLRLGKAEDEHYNTVMVQGAAKSLAELKGLKYFGEEA